MIPLTTLLQNRKWMRREQPFDHIVARDVFTPPFYAMLSGAMKAIIANGVHEEHVDNCFSRTITGYDAYGLSIDDRTPWPLSLFATLEWHNLLTAQFGVKGTRQINVGAHHHIPGSNDGFVHNDFNPVFFPVHHKRGIGFQGGCDYKSGGGEVAQVEVVRAVAMIFFLANDDWREGEGGECGLFAKFSPTVDTADVLVPPENNSLVMFECTPGSYHSFLHNPRYTRTSIIMWAHRTMKDALKRWPADQLERWNLKEHNNL